jgi:hypothetical protein
MTDPVFFNTIGGLPTFTNPVANAQVARIPAVGMPTGSKGQIDPKRPSGLRSQSGSIGS